MFDLHVTERTLSPDLSAESFLARVVEPLTAREAGPGYFLGTTDRGVETADVVVRRDSAVE